MLDLIFILINAAHDIVFLGSTISGFFILKALFVILPKYKLDWKEIKKALAKDKNFIASTLYINLILFTQVVFGKCPLNIITNLIAVKAGIPNDFTNEFLFGVFPSSDLEIFIRIILGIINIYAFYQTYINWTGLYSRFPALTTLKNAVFKPGVKI